MKFSDDGTHLVDQIVANPENVFTWTAKPDASEYIGSAWFSDIEAMGYSDGVSWNLGKSARNTTINIATFGDSTANTGDYTSPANQDTRVFDSVFPGSGATIVMLSGTKWLLSSKYPMAKLVFNGGVNSETLENMAARDAAVSSITRRSAIDINSSYADLIIVRMGINSMTAVTSGGVTSAEMDTLESSYKTMLDRLVSTGCFVLVEGIYGYGSNPPSTQQISDTQAAVLELNSRISAYIYTLPERIRYLNTLGLTHDSTGAYYTNMSYDGTHLSLYGAGILADAEAVYLNVMFGVSAKIRYPGINLATNQMLLTTTSESYGTLATGYTVAAGSNYAVSQAKIEVINDTRMQTAVYTPTGAGSLAMTAQLKLPAGAALFGTVLSGDQYGIEFDYFISMADGVSIIPDNSNITINALIYKSGAGRVQATIDSASTVGSNLTSMSGRAVFNPIKINDVSANLSDFQLYLSVIYTAANSVAGNALKLGVGGYRLVKLT